MRSYADTLVAIEGGLFHDEDALAGALDTLPPPRSPDMLLARLRALALAPRDTVIDLGCGNGQYACAIAEATASRVLALDLSLGSVIETRNAAEGAARGRVAAARAIAEALPVRPCSVAAIWCRDMLNHVDLPATLRECAAALRPGATMLVYQTFATRLLEPAEARRIFDAFAIVAENMRPAYFERCAADAGFTIVERDAVGGEWRERWEADGTRKTSEGLMRASRLIRGRDAIVERFGQPAYDFAVADQLWGVYQMIGKLCPTIYVLRAP